MTTEEFDDLERYAPTMPPETCPIIDGVIDAVASANKYLGRADRARDIEQLQDLVSDVESELRSVYSDLELLRRHNAKLRECAHYWQTACEESVTEDATPCPA